MAWLGAMSGWLFPDDHGAVKGDALGFATHAGNEIVLGKSLVDAAHKGLAYACTLLVDAIVARICYARHAFV